MQIFCDLVVIVIPELDPNDILLAPLVVYSARFPKSRLLDPAVLV